MPLSRPTTFLLVVSSVLVALVSYRFVLLGLPMSFPGFSGQLENNLTAFTAHVVAAPIALLLGAVQLLALVQVRPALHRWLGRIYGLSVLVGAVSGFSVAITAEGGLSAQVGFAVLACAWLVVTFIGISHARARRFVEHRRWMMRSFALTFAGVTLRLQLIAFTVFGMEYEQASIWLAWSCWVPNALLIEWWLRRHSVAA